ncbi:MAG: carbohydrate ABC transporter permease [Treponema sp.]|nr:carbohydrate ABC transporter permease [Treponema sp.]
MKKRIVGRVFVVIGLLIGAIFAGAPIVWMIACSFKPNAEIFEYPPRLFSDNLSFEKYSLILTTSSKLRFFLNSYLVSFSVTILTLIVAILAAYSFSRYDFKFKKALNMIIIGIQAVPPITLLIPYFGLIVLLRIYNTYWALILTYMIFTLPYAILMMTGYFNTLPRELDEAVMIDGAGSATVLWRFLVPVSIPGIISVAIYTFMVAWNEYIFALTLTKTNEMRTVPIGIMILMGQHYYEWNEMMAMSILGCLPVLILFMFFQRYFLQGMTQGAIKN